MSEMSLRLIGAVSLVLSVALQLTRLAAEYQSWDVYPSFSLSYSVHPSFLHAALVLQAVLQVYWLLKPRDTDTGGVSDIENAESKESTDHVEDYILQLAGPLTFFDRFSYMPVYLFSNIFLSALCRQLRLVLLSDYSYSHVDHRNLLRLFCSCSRHPSL